MAGSLVARVSDDSKTGPAPASISGLLSTLIPVGLLALIYVVLFLLFRNKYRRVYQPRTYLGTLMENQRSPSTSPSTFGWISDFIRVPDEYVLSHHSLDGYFYLRFFKTLLHVFAIGMPLTWVVLMSVYATSHGGQKQFDRLSFSNILPSQDGDRLYATVGIAWLFFGFIMFTIAREAIYFVHVKQAYLLLPGIASRISSRTVLFTNLPTEYINEAKLREAFPSILHVWMPTNTEKLDELVQEREKTALKLEGAEIKLSKTANDKRLKAAKKGRQEEANEDPTHWLVEKDRPTHRLGKFGLYGKKVDTINWSRSHLTELTPKIDTEREMHLTGKEKFNSAVFIEFTTVQAAQAAFYKINMKLPKGFIPRTTGSAPQEIIWNNLNMGNTQRRIRMIIASAIIFAMIWLWVPITAFIGAVSNLPFLQQSVGFLGWLSKLGPVTGIITSLLPVVALAVALMLVPIIMRLLFKLAGAATISEVELRTQNWYFVFQVIQVFLVTTLASGAISSAPSIIKNPSTATHLLANGLPRASNFYIDYMVLYGLSGASGALLNIGALVVYIVLGKLLDKTPRKKYNRYLKLSGIKWGSSLPVYTNIGVIVITYSCIAPLILGFAAIGFFLLYHAFRYNMIYTQNVLEINTQGRAFRQAILQLFTGLYIGEICLIGLVSISTAGSPHAAGPLALIIILLVFTIIFHVSLKKTLKAIEQNISHESEAVLPQQEGDLKHTANDPPIASSRRYNNRTTLLLKLVRVPAVPSFHTFLNTPQPDYDPATRREAYLNPAIWTPAPKLWIVHDQMGISTREKTDTSRVVEISDAGAWFDEKGKITTILAQEGEKGSSDNLARQAFIWQDPVNY